MTLDPRTTPLGVALDGQEALVLRWADGHESHLPLWLLRRNCPCATCKVARDSGPLRVLAGPTPATLEALEVAPVGHYALRIDWNDGHRSGIYPYEMLRSLCGCATCGAGPRPDGPPAAAPPRRRNSS